jgi:predicted phage tail protein
MSDVQILPALKPVTAVVMQANPFASAFQHLEAQEGLTMQQIVDRANVPEKFLPYLRVFIEDREVPRRLWATVRARRGKTVYLRAVPQGGGGGHKNPLAAILMVVVAIVAIVAQQYYAANGIAALGIQGGGIGAGVAGAVIAAGISLVGAMIVNALFPPPKSDVNGAGSSRYTLNGASNSLQPYAYIPRVLGKRRIYPMLAAHPYSENQGDDQYIRLLLCVGYGPLNISDIRIGDTPIGVFAGVQVETREGWLTDQPTTLYTTDIHEQDFQVQMNRSADPDADWISRYTDDNTSEASIDVSCLRGLAHFNDDGSQSQQSVGADVQYRLVGTPNWITPNWVNSADDGLGTPGTIEITDQTTSTAIRSGHVIFPQAGQWEVRVRRNVAMRDPSHDADTIYWTALRSIKYQAPVVQKGIALIAVRIKATAQLNGTPDTINCVATSYLPVWDSSYAIGQYSWQLSQNPAWAYLLVLLYRALDDPQISPQRIDHPALLAWAQACDPVAVNDPGKPRWQYNAVLQGGSIFAALQQISNSCRASFTMRDGKYSIFVDLPQTVPVQHITPANSSGYQGAKLFADLPHALRISFQNEEKDYADDEILVFDDGYDQSNATIYETLSFDGITRSAQCWREGRYFLAAAKLRPETHTVTMDIEHLRCTLGDLVRFSYDVVSIGLAAGKIKRPIYDAGGNITGYELDGPVQMDGGHSYAMRVRLADGSSNTFSLVSTVGVSAIVSLANPIESGSGIAPDTDDLYMFGESERESAPMIIKAITPSSNLTATITMLDAQPGIWTADSLSIPSFDDYITVQTPIRQQPPATPAIATIRSDETVIMRLSDGTLQDRILITMQPQSGGFVPAVGYETQYRLSGGARWTDAPETTIGDPNCYISPVIELQLYDIRVRAVSANGTTSDWVEVTGYQVVGKTSPPNDVTGFGGVSTSLGAQLSWNQNPDIDLAGYTLKEGDSWAEGTVLSAVMKGTSFFLQFDDANVHTVMIKAVDVLGNESRNAQVVSVQAIAPDDVPYFDAYPQQDSFMFKWTKIADAGFEYEIRCGSAWALGQVVGRFAGDTATVKWPVSSSGNVTFWIKSLSPAGLYSIDARYATILAQPLPSRNMVYTRDFVGAGFPGIKLDLTVDGEFAEIAKDANGGNRPAGDYYEEISLSNAFYARNWMTLVANSVTQDGLTWDNADFAWDAPDSPTWQGILGDADGAQVAAYISTSTGTLDASDVEGWRLSNSLVGLKGTQPAEQVGVTYGPGWFSEGLDVTDTTRVSWAVDVPAIFSLTFDFSPDQVNASDDAALVRLTGPADFLLLFFDRITGTFALVDQAGQRLDISVPLEQGDNLVFAISQSSTQRALYGATRRYPTPVYAQGNFAPAGTFSTLALHA